MDKESKWLAQEELGNNCQMLTVTHVSNSRVRYMSIKFKIIMDLILNWEMCKLTSEKESSWPINFVLLEPWQLFTLSICPFHICLGVPLNWPKLNLNLGTVLTYKSTGSKPSNLVFILVLQLSLMSTSWNPNFSQSNCIIYWSKNMRKALCQVLWKTSEKHLPSTHPRIHLSIHQSIYQSIYSFNINWSPATDRHWNQRWTKYRCYY